MIEVFGHPTEVDILAIGVHPDDIELSCSATLLKQMSMGNSVGIADMTRGELGSRGTPELRLKESRDAAELMGVAFRVNLEMEDGFFAYSRSNLINLIRIIRMSKPKIVLCNALEDRHPDHGRSAKLQADACYYSGLIKINTEGMVAHRPKAVYHYIQDRNLKPDFCVDVTGYEQKKMESIRCYSSQFHKEEGMTGPQTPISSAQFMRFIMAKMASYGRSIGVDYAEGYNVGRIPGINDLFTLL